METVEIVDNSAVPDLPTDTYWQDLIAKHGVDSLNTPMMKQYWEIKNQYRNAILFFRMGDFYELFFDDAVLVAPKLGLTLTSRQKNEKFQPIPMAGIPYHAVTNYLHKLSRENLRIAICDQVEDPKDAVGIVRREVTQVITPGVPYDSQLVEASEDHFLGCVQVYLSFEGVLGFELVLRDVLSHKQLLFQQLTRDELCDQLRIYSVRELVVSEALEYRNLVLSKQVQQLLTYLQSNSPQLMISTLPESTTQSALQNIETYLQQLKKIKIETADVHVQDEKRNGTEYANSHMRLDFITLKHLEIIHSWGMSSLSDHENTLLKVLDHCKTAMGSRLLKDWLKTPLKDVALILKRQKTVQAFLQSPNTLQEIRQQLTGMLDLSRLCGKAISTQLHPRDTKALQNILMPLELIHHHLRVLLQESSNKASALKDICEQWQSFKELHTELQKALVDEPPVTLRDGGIFKIGYDARLDELITFTHNSQQWLSSYEETLRAQTNIGNLKVKHNNIFGYFIEVSQSHLSKVPSFFQRRQTLTNGERFITPELKNFETQANRALQDRVEREQELFQNILGQIRALLPQLLHQASLMSQLDVLSTLAYVARKENYSCPTFSRSNQISAIDLRHPVIEKKIGRENFTTNTIVMGAKNPSFILLTGPNMSGKSTFQRSVALNVILAQIGSFVAASQFELSPVDALFTRIGAHDNLADGDSTFMVEMKETAHILRHTTAQSLVLIDELGRGTSTYDGVSIAYCVAEYIIKQLKAKCIFATHYHELTSLEKFKDVALYTIVVEERDGEIKFLHQLKAGGSQKSFGIHVARLAGLPPQVIQKSQAVLSRLEVVHQSNQRQAQQQLSLFD